MASNLPETYAIPPSYTILEVSIVNNQGFMSHNHGSVTHTSCDNDHSHQCLDITGKPVLTADGNHVHYSESFVMYEHGHTHFYKSVSSPAISLPNGYHTHNWDFYTSYDAGHRHQVRGLDMPAPNA